MYARARKINITRGVLAAFALAALLYLPAFAADDPPPSQQAGSLSADGIFSCNGGGQYANAGTLAAVGGVYVPVNDAAVTINTGYLAWKFCVLDGVNRKIAEAAGTQLGGSILRDLTTGRKTDNGNSPLYVVSEGTELLQKTDPVILDRLNNLEGTVFGDEIKPLLAISYVNTTRNPEKTYATTWESADDYRKFVADRSPPDETFWTNFTRLANWADNPWGNYDLAQQDIQRAQTAAIEYQKDEWLWGNGFYSIKDDQGNTVTPSYLVSQGAEQVAGSGFRCLENVHAINEMCNSLWSGLSNKLLDANGNGLTGITQAQNGLPSYVSRMVAEASGSVRQQAVNAAIGILANSRKIEALYLQAQEQIANVLASAISKLRGAEKACWEQLIPKVQEYATAQGAQIKVATSTQFSQAVIDAQIAPIATQVAENVRTSARALSVIDQLIQGVTNSSSATLQKQALETLDSMVHNHQLHTGDDLQRANKQRDDVTAAATSLVEDTIKAWAGGDNNAAWDGSIIPGTGWCNYNNQDTIKAWFNKWKR